MTRLQSKISNPLISIDHAKIISEIKGWQFASHMHVLLVTIVQILLKGRGKLICLILSCTDITTFKCLIKTVMGTYIHVKFATVCGGFDKYTYMVVSFVEEKYDW